MRYYVTYGFALWLVGAIAVRLIGHYLFAFPIVLLTFTLTIPLLALVVWRLFAARRLAATQRPLAAIALVLPGMALDVFCVLYAATLFPNLSAAEHLVLAAWLLEAYAVGLASALIPARVALGCRLLKMATAPNPPAPRLLQEAELPRIPRQARSQAKRQAVLAAALRLFSERGYEAVGIEEIATAAQTGVGSVYAYFRSKQQLLLVLMQTYLAVLQELDLRAPFTEAPGDRVSAIASALRQALVPDRAYAGLWRAWREAVSRHAELRPRDAAIAEWMRLGVATLIEGARASGRLRPDLDVVATAAVINAIAWQLSLVPPHDEAAVIAAAANMIFHAIFTDAEIER